MLALSTSLDKIAYAKQMCSRLKYITYKDFVNHIFSQIANFKQCPASKKTNLRNILLRIANLPKYFWQCMIMNDHGMHFNLISIRLWFYTLECHLLHRGRNSIQLAQTCKETVFQHSQWSHGHPTTRKLTSTK